MSILLSIKPKYAELIYSGQKTFEMRHTIPLKAIKRTIYKEEISEFAHITTRPRIYLCESGSGGMITGYFVLGNIYQRNIRIFGISSKENIEKYSCLSWEAIEKYYKRNEMVTAWMVHDVVKYDTPRHISELGINRAPQSWCYTKGVDLI